MWKNVTESNDKIRKNVTRSGFFRRSEGSLNAHFTQVCFFLHFYQLHFYLQFRQQCQQIAESEPDGGGIIVRMNTDDGGWR